MRFDIVERFVADSTGERGIARDYDNVFIAAAQISSHSHAEPRGKRRASMTGTVAIVFAFRAQKKSVEALELPHRMKTIEAAGKNLMDVALMTDVHDKAVSRRIEDTMQSNGQFDHAEIRSQMSPSLREDLDQLIAYFLRELRQILFTKRFAFGFDRCFLRRTRFLGRLEFLYYGFPGAITSNDLDLLLGVGKTFLADFYQFHSFLVADDQIFEWQFT